MVTRANGVKYKKLRKKSSNHSLQNCLGALQQPRDLVQIFQGGKLNSFCKSTCYFGFYYFLCNLHRAGWSLT